MMSVLRIQAQLTENQARQLRELAAEEGVSVAELLRRGADLVLERRPLDTSEDRRRRARSAVGRFADADTQVAARHDEHLDEAFRA
jgi:hypothetical protein